MSKKYYYCEEGENYSFTKKQIKKNFCDNKYGIKYFDKSLIPFSSNFENKKEENVNIQLEDYFPGGKNV